MRPRRDIAYPTIHDDVAALRAQLDAMPCAGVHNAATLLAMRGELATKRAHAADLELLAGDGGARRVGDE